MAAQELQNLFEKLVQGKMSPQEIRRMEVLLHDKTNDQTAQNLIASFFEKAETENIPIAERKVLFEDMMRRALEKETESKVLPTAHRVHFLKRSWFRYAAAIVLIVGGAITAIVVSSDPRSTNPAATLSQRSATSDIPPGGDKAYLTLADGSIIVLDSAANGSLATQGNAAIVKLANGQIAYNLKGSATGEIVMNTMTTPKGGQYQLTLPDGSKVWLNAASSIQFPAAFMGSERKVKIAGEVYFEVAKNKKQPFIVDIDGKANVQVLGTSFNINSYSNEESIKATLVDGSVKVIAGGKEAILKPGYRAVVDQENDGKNAMIQVQTTNIDQDLAWKNGVFNLENLDVYAVTRQLERWYDIKVRYEEPIHNVVVQGEIFRNTNLADVIDGLRKVGVKWRLEGKTLIVL